MIFTETKLTGAFIIDIEPREDERGFFTRAFCQHEFAEHGLKPVIAQANIGFNKRKGTVRGMHFQCPPAAETKLVRASRGAMLDIIVDLRPESADLPAALSASSSPPTITAASTFRSGSRTAIRRSRTTPKRCITSVSSTRPVRKAVCDSTIRVWGWPGRCR